MDSINLNQRKIVIALLIFSLCFGIEIIDGINHKSFFEKAIYKLKRKSPAPIYVFKYS